MIALMLTTTGLNLVAMTVNVVIWHMARRACASLEEALEEYAEPLHGSELQRVRP